MNIHLFCRYLSVVILLAMSLMACTQTSSTATLESLERISLSDELQGIYQSSCANCHANAAVKAPQTGDQVAWQIVFNKPFELIMDRVINGYAGMPPAGQCFECNQDQLAQLVHYMSRPSL